MTATVGGSLVGVPSIQIPPVLVPGRRKTISNDIKIAHALTHHDKRHMNRISARRSTKTELWTTVLQYPEGIALL